ncbi:hypothetical protein F5Y15DRAFT_25025 [Xylariaceae sp. FL0016]|nr:hypothetical protein F5Y15DRAFT_25025 [Xylariaceae sp. FL0016]
MAVAGRGPQAMVAMWALTTATFVIVLLRAYSRLIIVRKYGREDHAYDIAFVCRARQLASYFIVTRPMTDPAHLKILLLVYTVMMTISAMYGFGQGIDDLQPGTNYSTAMLFESLGQTSSMIGMATAKWSLGLFLLRLVNSRWQKAIIWSAMIWLLCAGITNDLIYWLDCKPPAYFWDPSIEVGHCDLTPLPISYLLSISCVVVDLLFAAIPWLVMGNLRIDRREKLLVLSSMSLGVVSAACGIKRTLECPSLVSTDYLLDTVDLVVWTAAEMAVTMICLGIPLCRPLYRSFLDKLNLHDHQSKALPGPCRLFYAKNTIGGGKTHRKCNTLHSPSKFRALKRCENQSLGSSIEFWDQLGRTNPALGLGLPHTSAFAAAVDHDPCSNYDEEALVEHVEGGLQGAWQKGIRVTEEFSVTRSRNQE